MAPIFRACHFTKVPAAGAVDGAFHCQGPKPKVTVFFLFRKEPGKLSHGQDEKLTFSNQKTYWAGNSAVTLRNLVVQPS